jgi:hypothetical protein
VINGTTSAWAAVVSVERRQRAMARLDGRVVTIIPISTLENAQTVAAHESPRTTKLYDRTGDEITLDEVERIAI